jgi:hypothetical protein
MSKNKIIALKKPGEISEDPLTAMIIKANCLDNIVLGTPYLIKVKIFPKPIKFSI